MRFLKAVLLAAVLAATTAPGLADARGGHGGGHGGGHFGGGFGLGVGLGLAFGVPLLAGSYYGSPYYAPPWLMPPPYAYAPDYGTCRPRKNAVALQPLVLPSGQAVSHSQEKGAQRNLHLVFPLPLSSMKRLIPVCEGNVLEATGAPSTAWQHRAASALKVAERQYQVKAQSSRVCALRNMVDAGGSLNRFRPGFRSAAFAIAAETGSS